MVSVGPDTQSYNFTHMYSFVDLNELNSNTKPKVTKGSIYDFIDSNPSFTKFKTIITHAKNIGLLNDIQANCTALIPNDENLKHIPDEYFCRMDDGLARQILASSIIDRKIDGKLLTSSPVAYYITRNPSMRMYVENINSCTTVNSCARVIKFDIKCNNGLIHVIDNLIIPNNDHFMN